MNVQVGIRDSASSTGEQPVAGSAAGHSALPAAVGSWSGHSTTLVGSRCSIPCTGHVEFMSGYLGRYEGLEMFWPSLLRRVFLKIGFLLKNYIYIPHIHICNNVNNSPFSF